MSEPFDTPEWRLSILSASPYFQGVPTADLVTLALAMRLTKWPREHIFTENVIFSNVGGGWGAPGERPLSLIVSGKVAIIQRYTTTGSRHLLGPGEMFGLESVYAWLYPTVQSPPDQFSGNTVDSTWCLDLYPPDFFAVFGDDPTQEPLRSVLNAWALAIAYPIAMSSFMATQQLSCLRQDQLQALLTYANVQTLAPGEPLPGISKGSPPTAAYVVLSGNIERVSVPIDPNNPPLTEQGVGRLSVGQVVGLAELFDEQPMGFSAVSCDAQVLCLSKDVLLDTAPLQIPLFLRSIEQALGNVPLYATLLGTPLGRLLSATTCAIVPNMTGFDPQIAASVQHLASYMASAFFEDVLVVRLLPGPPFFALPPAPWEAAQSAPVGTVQTVEVALTDFNLNWLLQWTTTRWNVVLIDPTALPPVNVEGSPYLQALVDLNIPITSSVLLDRPIAWEGVAGWMLAPLMRWALPTAMIANNDGLGLPPAWLQPSGPGLLQGVIAKALTLVDGVISAAQQRYEQELAALGPERTCDGAIWPSWPVATARFLVTETVLQGITPGPLDAQTTLAFARWARAITRRRVGVAIGGAAALSFIGSAMLQGLEQRGIPVDMVSGTSFGTVVGAFYTVHGLPGLTRLESSWPSLYLALSYSSVSSYPLALWANSHLDFADLNDIPTALFPVATLASNEHEWPIRGGSVGQGVRASGSLPPFAPTVHGRLRLLDGGFSADVPCQVLSDEGADLIIAVNPYTFPPTLPGRRVWIPVLSSCVMTENPILRMLDWTRGYQMLWRFAAVSQLPYADVVYNSDNPYTQPLAFFAGRWIVSGASHSNALAVALEQATSAWRALLGEPLVYMTPFAAPNPIVLTVDVKFRGVVGFIGAAPSVHQVLTPESIPLLDRAARTLKNNNLAGATLTIKIQATGQGSPAADQTAADLRGQRISRFLVFAGLPSNILQIQASPGPAEGVTLVLQLP